jgi:hypothetical protein
MFARKCARILALGGLSIAALVGSSAVAPVASADDCASPEECKAWSGYTLLDTIVVTASYEPGGSGGGDVERPEPYVLPPNPYRICQFLWNGYLVDVEVYGFLDVAYYFMYPNGGGRTITPATAGEMCASPGRVF